MRRVGRACGRRPTSCARRCSTCWGRGSSVARVLDACAGTGAVGIEALSRGRRARHIRRPRSAGHRSDRRESGALRRGERLCYYPRRLLDAACAIRAAAVFDLDLSRSSVRHRCRCPRGRRRRRLAPGGLLIVEHARRSSAPARTYARAIREVMSGDSALSFYATPEAASRVGPDGNAASDQRLTPARRTRQPSRPGMAPRVTERCR